MAGFPAEGEKAVAFLAACLGVKKTGMVFMGGAPLHFPV
jgi:hypothetical protein